MPNYFNVKNNTYSINHFLPLLPVVPLLLLKSKGDKSTNQSVMASTAIPSSYETNENQSHSLLQSIGSIFNGSNALDILSSVEPYLNNNSQQLINAIKGFSRSLDALKAYRTASISTNENTQSTDSFNMIKALSANFNPDIKNSINPIIDILSTVKGIQSTAPVLQQMLSPNGLSKMLSSFSTMMADDGNSSTTNQSDNDANNGLMGLSEIIRMISALNTMKAEPLFNSTNSDTSETKLLEAITDDEPQEEKTDESNETDSSGSLVDMAEKLQEIINKE